MHAVNVAWRIIQEPIPPLHDQQTRTISLYTSEARNPRLGAGQPEFQPAERGTGPDEDAPVRLSRGEEQGLGGLRASWLALATAFVRECKGFRRNGVNGISQVCGDTCSKAAGTGGGVGGFQIVENQDGSLVRHPQ